MVLVFAVAIFRDFFAAEPDGYGHAGTARSVLRGALAWNRRARRDELSRLIHGARISLVVGLCAPVIGLVIGGGSACSPVIRRPVRDARSSAHGCAAAFPPLISAGCDCLCRESISIFFWGR